IWFYGTVPGPAPHVARSGPVVTVQPANAPPVVVAEQVQVAPSGLALPVVGIKPDQLVDTFDAARSAGRRHDAIAIMAAEAALVGRHGDQSLPAACRKEGRRLGRACSFKTLSQETDMKISGVDIRPGNIIEYEGGIWRAVKIQHTQPGKGGAYMQVEMKNLIDGRKTNVRFRSAETVERVRLDTKDYQFLFADSDMLTFMDKDNYEQISLPRDLLGDAAAFPEARMDWV